MSKSKTTGTQDIALELSDESTLNFSVTREDYIKFINDTNPKEKFNSMHNFLMRTVVEDDKPRLRELLLNPANTSELLGEVIEEYKPDVEVVVKKRKNSANK